MTLPKNPLTLHDRELFNLEVRIEEEKADALRLQHAGQHDAAREALAYAERLIQQRDKLAKRGPTTDF